MAHVTEQLDAVVQLVPLHHLLKIDFLGAIAADNEVHVRVLLADFWDDVHHQVHALAIHQARDSDDGYSARLAGCGVGREQGGVGGKKNPKPLTCRIGREQGGVD